MSEDIIKTKIVLAYAEIATVRAKFESAERNIDKAYKHAIARRDHWISEVDSIIARSVKAKERLDKKCSALDAQVAELEAKLQ